MIAAMATSTVLAKRRSSGGPGARRRGGRASSSRSASSRSACSGRGRRRPVGETAPLAVQMALGQERRGLEQVGHAEVLGALDLELDLPARLLEHALRRARSVAERLLDLGVVDHELAQALVDPAQDLAQHVDELALALGTGHARRGREVDRVRVPVTVAVPHHHLVARFERVAPGGQRVGLLVARQLRVAAPHDRERVVVAPEPHVQAVLLDPAAAIQVAAARALAAQPPARLVDRDLVLAPRARAWP